MTVPMQLRSPRRGPSILLWLAVAALGAGAFAVLACKHGEPVNAAWLLTAALCSYAVGYRFYSRIIAGGIFALDPARATPAVRHNDGHDYVPTNRWVVFGHHFAAIAGAGPLVGPILAAQFGFLPGALWIIIGVVLGGAAQDLVILCASLRRDGKSLGQLAKEEVGPGAGLLALVSIIGIIIILIAFLSLVVVNALAKSPWATVTLLLTVPIALIMGLWMRILRPGRVMEASALGVVALIGALLLGKAVADSAYWAPLFTFSRPQIAWGIITYGFVASVLPVWMLLAPRDYLSAFVKVGTIVLLAAGVLLVLPSLGMPAVNPLCIGNGAWAAGGGPVVPGTIFPFCFITIACGAISGFHALVASGTTPKLIANEMDAPLIGYGGMLTESLVAILALIAACSLHPGVYFAMNAGALQAIDQDPVAVAGQVNGWLSALGATIAPDELSRVAREVGEQTIIGRTGGAPTLAVGMAHIFSEMIGGTAMMAFWYHFAILFEALFILTTVDAGTRVGRFLLQDLLAHAHPALGRVSWYPAMLLTSALVVAGWGYFVLAALEDNQGGVSALLPLFGIANQVLAAVALSVATVIVVRMGKARYAVVTVLPLAWLAAVTLDAGWIKIASPNPALGFLAKADALTATLAGGGLDPARAAILRHQLFNQQLDCLLCALFMAVIIAMLLLCAWECVLLGSGRKPLHPEEPPRPGPSEAELREA
jgi:carbon starvation protein